MAGWIEAFPEARAQLDRLTEGLQKILQDRLQAVLLHGSLAMAGFDPQRSDLDVLVIVSSRPLDTQYAQLGRLLPEVSGAPHPLELSLLLEDNLHPWRHPCPHLLHYGESHRQDFAQTRVTPHQDADPDLAMHLTVARHRGVDLLGSWPPSNLPEVPAADFLAAIRTDFLWAANRPDELRDYRLANACRTLAYLEQGLVLSKSEGMDWCRQRDIKPADALVSVAARLEIDIPGAGPST
ncbi:MAG: DUF4111 domain-containing protein [Pseudomonadales bacterium]